MRINGSSPTQSITLSSTHVGVFYGTASATGGDNAYPGGQDVEVGGTGSTNMTVVALYNGTMTPPPADIQILQNFSGSVSASGTELQGADIWGDIDVTQPGTNSLSEKEISESNGVMSTSDDGPINVTVSDGGTFTISYQVDLVGHLSRV